ncbi:MAG: 16S rRNA (cytosine(967)-C(5))-methyltransferase [Gallionellales bacterium GWA2_55_18]|nr:MAG: 16S rRNA (cytosine(967)-C(5))-methyltransferase [Gallionellales bacterium GWA2_55_18]
MHNIQLAAGQIIQQVLADGRNLNQVLDESLRRKSVWTPAQRAALQDLSYGTLRFYGQLKTLLGLLLHKPMLDQRIYYMLLVALYQLQYSKAAQHAVVDHAVRSAQMLNVKVSGLANAILRNFLRNQAALLEQAAQHAEGKYNHPQWWIDELEAQYGERSAAILEAGNRHPPLTLRVNRRLGTTADYQAQLEQQDMRARLIELNGHAGSPLPNPLPQAGEGANESLREFYVNALQLDKPVGVDKLPGFFAGLVSVQDAGAQYAARLLNVCDGMRVLDACAAPGGKTAHILECAQVEMVAVDKDEQRLQRVAENLRRLGLPAQLLTGDASEPEKWWDGKLFQRILADVPCSASGVVRRHPDIKWLRRHSDITGFAAQQLNILRALWRLLAQDGKLLYATCSVFNQENEQVIAAFLAQQPDARRLPVVLPDGSNGQMLPNDRHDGFFYALLHKQMTGDITSD